MALHNLLDTWNNLKTNWKAAKLLAKGKGVRVTLIWSAVPETGAGMGLLLKNGDVVDVSEYERAAREIMNNQLERHGLELAQPGEPAAFTVKFKTGGGVRRLDRPGAALALAGPAHLMEDMTMEPKQKREVERALRAAGFSRSQAVVAVAVMSRILNALSTKSQ